MMRSIPPRLRAPVNALAGGSIVAAVSVVAYGWGSLWRIGIVIAGGAVVYYVWAGRDTDYSALLRGQADERQAFRRLKILALVGQVTTAAAWNDSRPFGVSRNPASGSLLRTVVMLGGLDGPDDGRVHPRGGFCREGDGRAGEPGCGQALQILGAG